MWFVKLGYCTRWYTMHNYMPHVVTRTCETTHQHAKHTGAWPPGLAQHPGEASPGDGQMDQIIKVLKRLWSFIGSKHRNDEHYDQYIRYTSNRCDKIIKQRDLRNKTFRLSRNIGSIKTQGKGRLITIYFWAFCEFHGSCLFVCCYKTCFAQFGLATGRIDWPILGFLSWTYHGTWWTHITTMMKAQEGYISGLCWWYSVS